MDVKGEASGLRQERVREMMDIPIIFAARRGRRRMLAASAACLTALFALSACGSGTQAGDLSIDPNHPYAAEFRRNYDEVTVPIAKGILEDGKITEAEMSELRDLVAQCMAERDVEWSTEEDDVSVSLRPGQNLSFAQVDELMQQCYDETGYEFVASLYVDMFRNPDNLKSDDWNLQVFACMKSHDLIDGTMDPDYFLSLYSDPNRYSDPGYEKYFAALDEPNHPDYDANRSAVYAECMRDPLGAYQERR